MHTTRDLVGISASAGAHPWPGDRLDVWSATVIWGSTLIRVRQPHSHIPSRFRTSDSCSRQSSINLRSTLSQPGRSNTTARSKSIQILNYYVSQYHFISTTTQRLGSTLLGFPSSFSHRSFTALLSNPTLYQGVRIADEGDGSVVPDKFTAQHSAPNLRVALRP
jgi:hypothetical protein